MFRYKFYPSALALGLAIFGYQAALASSADHTCSLNVAGLTYNPFQGIFNSAPDQPRVVPFKIIDTVILQESEVGQSCDDPGVSQSYSHSYKATAQHLELELPNGKMTTWAICEERFLSQPISCPLKAVK